MVQLKPPCAVTSVSTAKTTDNISPRAATRDGADFPGADSFGVTHSRRKHDAACGADQTAGLIICLRFLDVLLPQLLVDQRLHFAGRLCAAHQTSIDDKGGGAINANLAALRLGF